MTENEEYQKFSGTQEEVERFLNANPGLARNWVLKHVPHKMLDAWVAEKRLTVRGSEQQTISIRDSVTAGSEAGGNVFEQFVLGARKRSSTIRKTRNELLKMSHKNMFMELIRDIASELDVNVLCHKILVNVITLLNGDRGSLFLVRGTRDNKYLVSKLFDVTEQSTLEDTLHSEDNHITVAFGSGIVGSVALTKAPINIKDAYQDPRFNKTVDKKTGFRTTSILCMPIVDYEDEVVGVAQIMNKMATDSQQAAVFTPQDEQVYFTHWS